jgi:hypothetical protein
MTDVDAILLQVAKRAYAITGQPGWERASEQYDEAVARAMGDAGLRRLLEELCGLPQVDDVRFNPYCYVNTKDLQRIQEALAALAGKEDGND